METTGSTLYMYQFPDRSTYSHLLTKLEILDPIEVILPSSICEGPNTGLMELIISFKSDILVTKIERRFFNEKDGYKLIKEICFIDYLNKLEIEAREKYYCYSAAAALIKYMECYRNMMFASNSTKILYSGSEQTISIDPITAKALELIVNQDTGKMNSTLFAFLNFTKTKSGFRLLRATIREPLRDLKTIESRLDLVSEYTSIPELQLGVANVLSKFLDIELIFSLIIGKPRFVDWKVGEKQIETLIQLRHTLQLIKPLIEQLKKAQHPIFKHYEELLQDSNYDEILSIIETTIDPDCKLVQGLLNIKHQKVFAIRKGKNGLLDQKRDVYSRLLDDVSQIADLISDRYTIPIKIGYSTLRGYHLIASTKSDSSFQVPAEFIRVTMQEKKIIFTTKEIITKNGMLSQALTDIFRISREILIDIFNQIRQKVGCLHKLTEIVSLMDLMQSFAWASSKYNMTRPLFDKVMAIKNGYHPFLLMEKSRDQITANDMFMSDDCNVRILRGQNMSGKSTFMKQTCILQILSQCGCFVPAEKATIKLVDQIFTRMGYDDDMESNCSSFSKEIKEVRYILDNFSDKSLAIIDEFGRGTAYEDGFALCWAVIEAFVGSKAFVFCATHYSMLTQMDHMYPEVLSQYFNNKHQVCDDCTITSLYGLEAAEESNLPKTLVANAYAKADADCIIEKTSAWVREMTFLHLFYYI